MSYKKRTQEEVEAIVKEVEDGHSNADICNKYGVSETALYRILLKHRGLGFADQQRSSSDKKKVNRLEKKIKEQEQEIKLLRAALKKF